MVSFYESRECLLIIVIVSGKRVLHKDSFVAVQFLAGEDCLTVSSGNDYLHRLRELKTFLWIRNILCIMGKCQFF